MRFSYSEFVSWICLQKKLLWKISQNSQKKQFWRLYPWNFIKTSTGADVLRWILQHFSEPRLIFTFLRSTIRACFSPFSSVYIVDFKQINICWVSFFIEQLWTSASDFYTVSVKLCVISCAIHALTIKQNMFYFHFWHFDMKFKDFKFSVYWALFNYPGRSVFTIHRSSRPRIFFKISVL